MIINNKPTYKCEHCRKLYQIQSACEKHEPICNSNPENFTDCSDCVFREMVKVTIYTDEFDGEHAWEKKAIKCTKLNHYIYPPKVARSHRGAYDLDDAENLPMPKKGTCPHYETEILF